MTASPYCESIPFGILPDEGVKANMCKAMLDHDIENGVRMARRLLGNNEEEIVMNVSQEFGVSPEYVRSIMHDNVSTKANASWVQNRSWPFPEGPSVRTIRCCVVHCIRTSLIAWPQDHLFAWPDQVFAWYFMKGQRKYVRSNERPWHANWSENRD